MPHPGAGKDENQFGSDLTQDTQVCLLGSIKNVVSGNEGEANRTIFRKRADKNDAFILFVPV